jgi:hypothetical protein
MNTQYADARRSLKHAGPLQSVHRLIKPDAVDATVIFAQALIFEFSGESFGVRVTRSGLQLVLGKYPLEFPEEFFEVSSGKPWCDILGRSVRSMRFFGNDRGYLDAIDLHFGTKGRRDIVAIRIARKRGQLITVTNFDSPRRMAQ